MIRAIVLNKNDNVATLIDAGTTGDEATMSGAVNASLKLGTDIPYGHKFATANITRGADILKYGKVIGRATAEIAVGEHVHVHNVESLRGRGDQA